LSGSVEALEEKHRLIGGTERERVIFNVEKGFFHSASRDFCGSGLRRSSIGKDSIDSAWLVRSNANFGRIESNFIRGYFADINTIGGRGVVTWEKK